MCATKIHLHIILNCIRALKNSSVIGVVTISTYARTLAFEVTKLVKRSINRNTWFGMTMAQMKVREKNAYTISFSDVKRQREANKAQERGK